MNKPDSTYTLTSWCGSGHITCWFWVYFSQSTRWGGEPSCLFQSSFLQYIHDSTTLCHLLCPHPILLQKCEVVSYFIKSWEPKRLNFNFLQMLRCLMWSVHLLLVLSPLWFHTIRRAVFSHSCSVGFLPAQFSQTQFFEADSMIPLGKLYSSFIHSGISRV